VQAGASNLQIFVSDVVSANTLNKSSI